MQTPSSTMIPWNLNVVSIFLFCTQTKWGQVQNGKAAQSSLPLIFRLGKLPSPLSLWFSEWESCPVLSPYDFQNGKAAQSSLPLIFRRHPQSFSVPPLIRIPNFFSFVFFHAKHFKNFLKFGIFNLLEDPAQFPNSVSHISTKLFPNSDSRFFHLVSFILATIVYIGILQVSVLTIK